MAWFRVDDKFHSHPKVLGAGNAAIGLFSRCGSWSSDLGTEGRIPRHVARKFGAPKEITALVTNRLWMEVDGGYVMNDFLEYNPSNEQVAERRALRAAAGAKGGSVARKNEANAKQTTKQTASNGEAKVNPRDVSSKSQPRPQPDPADLTTRTTHPSSAVPSEEERPVDNRRSEAIRLYAIEAVRRGSPRSASGYMAKAKTTADANPDLDRWLAMFPDAPADAVAAWLHGEKGSMAYYRRVDEIEAL